MKILILILIISIVFYFDILSIERIKKYIIEINNVYIDLFREKKRMVKITQIILFLVSEICSYLAIYSIFMKYVLSELYKSKGISIIIIIFLCGVFHYLIGYILLLCTNFHKYMLKSLEESIKSRFLLSYFFSSIFIVLLILVPNQLNNYVSCCFLSIGISYLINISLLFKFMKNPKSIKINENDNYSFGKIIIAVIMLILMVIINLFLLVVCTNIMDPKSFSNNPSNFDLLYFTIINFTTIGFGDIIPINFWGKFMSILIALTSILCISIFVGGIYSNRKK